MPPITTLIVARPGPPGNVDFDSANYYTVPVIDGMIAALTAAANARRLVAPVLTDNRISGLTHGFGARSDSLTTVTISANQLRASLVYIGEETTFKEIGIRVETLGASANCRLGIGEYDFVTKTASNIYDAGVVSCATTGDKTIAISQTYGPGWICLLAYASDDFGALGAAGSAGGYTMATTGGVSCTPVQTGTPYSAFGATEVFNTNSTSLLTTWLVGA